MRILHVVRTVDPAAGGVIESVRQMAFPSMRAGHSVTVATLDDPADPWVAGFDVPVVALGRGRGTYGHAAEAAARLRSAGATADVVVADGLWQYHSLLAHRVFAGRLPYVVYAHGMLDPWFKRTYPGKHLKKCLYWWLFEHRTLAAAAAVVFTTDEERRLARESFRPYRVQEQVLPIGTAAPPDGDDQRRAQADAFRAVCPGLGAAPYLLFLSRIHPKKGVDLLIDAFAALAASHPDVHLVVAGPDPDGLAAGLADRTRDHGIAGRVHWPGMLRGDAKWGAFRGALAFCLPSHQENFGIVVAEALACSVPVVTTTQVNIWREVVDGGGGIAVPDTRDGIRDGIGRVLDMSTEERAVMGSAGVRLFTERFHIDRAAAIRNDFLQTLVASHA
jgi:glycosyltransferase involved in cell wall biosynthesis